MTPFGSISKCNHCNLLLRSMTPYKTFKHLKISFLRYHANESNREMHSWMYNPKFSRNMAISIRTPDYRNHMWVFPTLLPRSWKHTFFLNVFACFITLRFPLTGMNGHKTVPVWQWLCAQSNVHKGMVCKVWSGRNLVEPWPQPLKPLGWTGTPYLWHQCRTLLLL